MLLFNNDTAENEDIPGVWFQNLINRTFITVKPVNKGHPRERRHIVLIDKWTLFGDYFVLFDKGMVTDL